MRKLVQGIVDYRERILPKERERFRKLADGQEPDALFISCSDSRVVPELLASTNPGDLFVNRNVGNMIPPADVDGESTGDLSEASAIEYALLVLNVTDVVICGHSECGAMKAACEGSSAKHPANLARWLHHASTAVFRLGQEGPLDSSLPVYDQLSQINVLVQLEHLVSYSIVKERLDRGELRLNGLWFDIRSGEMFAYQKDRRRFCPLDRECADQLLAGLK